MCVRNRKRNDVPFDEYCEQVYLPSRASATKLLVVNIR